MLMPLLCFVVAGLLLLGGGAAMAGDGKVKFPLHEPIDESRLAPTPTPRPKVFRGYGRYQGLFQAVCTELRSDGRSQKLYDISASAADVKEDDCMACRPLLKSFAVACKPTGSRKSKTLTPIPPQREPRAAALVTVSKLAETLVQDDATIKETLKAAEKFVQLISVKEGFTPGERDYFAILAEYFDRPFRIKRKTMQDAEETIEAPAGLTPSPAVPLDEMF